MSEWQPIESAPKDGTEVLLAIHDRGDSSKPFHRALAVWDPEGNDWKRDIHDPYSSTWPPSFWMPAPELPSNGDGKHG